jgi:hypothetical protein
MAILLVDHMAWTSCARVGEPRGAVASGLDLLYAVYFGASRLRAAAGNVSLPVLFGAYYE